MKQNKLRSRMMNCGYGIIDVPPPPLSEIKPLCESREGWRPFTPWHNTSYKETLEYILTVEKILEETLGYEEFERHSVEFRVNGGIEAVHTDGCYLRTICTVQGPGTVVIEEKQERQIFTGETLLLTGDPRHLKTKIKATEHKSPKYHWAIGLPRYLVLIVFHEKSYMENLKESYKQSTLHHNNHRQ